MFISKKKASLICIVLAASWCSSAAPIRVLADDKNNPAPAKTDAAERSAPLVNVPAPLTQRERLLLDRVELLEKRVAELEAKGQPSTPSAGKASQPSEAPDIA